MSLRLPAVTMIVVALLSLALWQAHQLPGRTSQAGSSSFEAGTTLYPKGQGIRLPEVRGPVVGEDRTLSLSGQLGHVLVINVWGSWCAPCRAEAPVLAAVSREMASRGVRFVGIDVRDKTSAAVEFEREHGITYPSIEDHSGQLLAKFTGIIPVSAIPSTVVVDAAGKIRARVIGQVDRSTLRSLLDELAQEVRS